MFNTKNRDRFGNTQLGEAVRDEFDNAQSQIATTFEVEHNPDGTHRFPAGDVVPVGAMLIWPTDTVPNSKWLFCRGQQVSRSTYSALFVLMSTTYGVGDGSTTFNLPNLQQRFPLGKAASGTGNTLGVTGGAIDHTHTGPSHTHTGPAHTHSIGSGGGHTHTVSGHTHAISSQAAHAHAITIIGVDPAGGSGVVVDQNLDALKIRVGASSDGGSTQDNSTTGSSGSHDHTGSTGSSSPGTDSQGAHDHGGTTGSEGTGTTSASGTGNTGTNNPPFLSINYIIFTGVEVN